MSEKEETFVVKDSSQAEAPVVDEAPVEEPQVVEATTEPPQTEAETLPAKEEEESSSNETIPLAKGGATLDEDAMNGFWARQFKRMATKAWLHLGISLVVSIVLSGIALTVGGFEVSVDNAGWQSRGTLIADRQTQLMLTRAYQEDLFYGGPQVWQDLQKNVQPGWETESLGNNDNDDSRRLASSPLEDGVKRRLPFKLDPRMLQDVQGLDGCDVSWYTNWEALEYETHLWPIWRSESNSDTIMDPDLLKDLCVAEQNTQKILESKGLCFGCEEGCLPPYSIVLYARLVVPNGFDMQCAELSEAWAEYQDATEAEWATCVADLKDVYDPKGSFEVPESCPLGFSPFLVEENFDRTGKMMYTSSIFATSEQDNGELYDLVDSFDHGTSKIYGAFDTQYEDFNIIFTDAAVGRDMALACGSAVITTLAMIVHTKR